MEEQEVVLERLARASQRSDGCGRLGGSGGRGKKLLEGYAGVELRGRSGRAGRLKDWSRGQAGSWRGEIGSDTSCTGYPRVFQGSRAET